MVLTDRKMNKDEVIKELELEPLIPEGGMFRQIYKCQLKCRDRDRARGTSIYYLLDSDTISKWHNVKSDEIWHYHAGSPAVQVLLFPDGKWERRVIGPNLKAGERPQSIIPAGVWQAAVLVDRTPGSWGLFGATVFPGFEYDDYMEKHFSEICGQWSGAIETVREVGLDI